jgi:hypothetical protein
VDSVSPHPKKLKKQTKKPPTLLSDDGTEEKFLIKDVSLSADSIRDTRITHILLGSENRYIYVHKSILTFDMDIFILSPVTNSDGASIPNAVCIQNTTCRLIYTFHMEVSLLFCEKSESFLNIVDT